MPNLAVIIKDEIRRLAKKEIKAAISPTKQAAAQYRRDIAQLKRQVQTQQREIDFLREQERKRIGRQPVAAEEGDLEGVRYSARSVRAQRQRLGLSAEEFAKLIGVSTLTVYNWENGKGRPRQERFAALVALRKIGKREARQKLAMLEGKLKPR